MLTRDQPMGGLTLARALLNGAHKAQKRHWLLCLTARLGNLMFNVLNKKMRISGEFRLGCFTLKKRGTLFVRCWLEFASWISHETCVHVPTASSRPCASSPGRFLLYVHSKKRYESEFVMSRHPCRCHFSTRRNKIWCSDLSIMHMDVKVSTLSNLSGF